MQMVMAANAITQVQIKTIQSRFMKLARAAESEAKTMASFRLNRTAQQYRDALTYRRNSETEATITLDASASHLELGYPSYDMIKAGLVRNNKKKKLSKAGYWYASIPFEQSTKAAKPGHPMNQVPIQIGQPGETTHGVLANQMKTLLGAFSTGAKKGDFRITQSGDDWSIKNLMYGQTETKELPGISSLLSGLQKDSAQVGQRNVSRYTTFRTATENPNRKAKWQHPGFAGVHIFKDLEEWCKKQMQIIVHQTLENK